MRCIYVFLSPVILSHAANNRKSLNHEISDAKKRTREIPIRKNFVRKISTRKTFGPTRKYFGHTKHPQEKICDPQNTHEGTIAQWH